jgi:hypothetical protein
MADSKISALPASTTPLAGTEVLPIVQSSTTKQVSVANLTAGRDIAATSLTTAAVQATNSGGLALKNSSGTTQLSLGAGGGDNITLSVATNITPANAAVAISPTGTGTVTINPATASTMNNVAIGGTTALAGRFTSVTATTGNFVVGTSGQGIDFSATPGTGTSELLADYEEGTWTPQLDSSGATFTYNAAQTGGIYVRVGRLVTLAGVLTLTAKSGGSTGGSLSFINFPFSPNSTDFGGSGPAFSISCFSYSITVPIGYEIWVAGVKNGNGILPLYSSTIGGGFRMFEYGDISATAVIQFAVTYQTT